MARRIHTSAQIIHKLREADQYCSLKVSRFNKLLARLRLQSRPIIVGERSNGGLRVHQAKRFKALERESIRLKRLVAEKELDIQIRNIQNCTGPSMKKVLNLQRNGWITTAERSWR